MAVAGEDNTMAGELTEIRKEQESQNLQTKIDNLFATLEQPVGHMQLGCEDRHSRSVKRRRHRRPSTSSTSSAPSSARSFSPRTKAQAKHNQSVNQRARNNLKGVTLDCMDRIIAGLTANGGSDCMSAVFQRFGVTAMQLQTMGFCLTKGSLVKLPKPCVLEANREIIAEKQRSRNQRKTAKAAKNRLAGLRSQDEIYKEAMHKERSKQAAEKYGLRDTGGSARDA
eukprot:TRINITY_DN105949_c0_g1_i1.p1 TRINITY_DN105949_c0_g1~~TRINITY_DN105949_c0_g1_i1.p1  ORF type:complete len:244 (-),score=40.03 TRINITY_DN105949_c0_g1_i1:317-994(-)